MDNVDGDRFLLNLLDWEHDVMRELAENEGVNLIDEMISYIMSARDYYVEHQAVAPIREFAKMHGMDRKAGPRGNNS